MQDRAIAVISSEARLVPNMSSARAGLAVTTRSESNELRQRPATLRRSVGTSATTRTDSTMASDEQRRAACARSSGPGELDVRHPVDEQQCRAAPRGRCRATPQRRPGRRR